MISYAQNFEDVMLARCFNGHEVGFYVDIGAWDATVDSVTKHFYDLGWSGINVEASPTNFAVISKDRPRDINLNLAVGATSGSKKFYEVLGTGLSTLRQDYAERYAKEGFEIVERHVETVCLSDLLDKYAQGRAIDFLKVDVEGSEAEVIIGGDWRRHRPRVVVVEATLPRQTELDCADWDPLLTDSGYLFAYFDSLNRWYVRKEDCDLLRFFRVPPNVFDDFRRFQEEELRREVDALRSEVRVLRQRLQSAMKKADRLDALSASMPGKVALWLSRRRLPGS